MNIIGNAALITRGKENKFYSNGAVIYQDGVIMEVGDTEALRAKYPEAEFLDAGGGVIMPGLINCHEHIYSALARGLSVNGYDPKGFLDILDGMWWKLDRHLTLEQTRASAVADYIDCIKNGVTTVFDHHASYAQVNGSLFTIADAARELGVRTCLCYEVSDRDGTEKMKSAVLENERFIYRALGDESDMLAGMFGLHASFTLSDRTLRYCREHTPPGAGYHIHVAEGVEDLHDCLKKHGKRIVDRLFDESVLGEKTIAAHCIYVNPHEMELLRETGTMVVHNPESNMGNACGCPPTMRLYKAGVLCGLGTDGYTQDMLESWKVANVLHKHHLCDANAAWGELPDMLFNGNAAIAGKYFKTPLGALEAGAAADIIVMDYIPRTPMDASNINGHMLFGMNGKCVKTTIINGELLMRDRVLQKIDEEQALSNVRTEAEKLWNSINS